MRISSWILSLTTLSIVALPACDPDSQDPTADDVANDDDDRGHVGKADLIGTCEDACGGQSNDGNCWCDDQCADFGDCCADQQDTCGEPATCEGENPAGCIETGCGEGLVCSTETDACISSACFCDESTGTWLCSADCSGGECVPEPTPAVCEGENPAGCVTTGCGEGETCSTETEACISSACFCDEITGSWVCTSDCSGGSCVPAEPVDVCPGTNPADNCIDGSCIPSGCSCDETNGTWLCTPDCSGGVEC